MRDDSLKKDSSRGLQDFGLRDSRRSSMGVVMGDKGGGECSVWRYRCSEGSRKGFEVSMFTQTLAHGPSRHGLASDDLYLSALNGAQTNVQTLHYLQFLNWPEKEARGTEWQR